jgi:hypothetical protein
MSLVARFRVVPSKTAHQDPANDRGTFPWQREATMIFRQLFEPVSYIDSYLIASRRAGEAVIIDPVLEKADRCLQL